MDDRALECPRDKAHGPHDEDATFCSVCAKRLEINPWVEFGIRGTLALHWRRFAMSLFPYRASTFENGVNAATCIRAWHWRGRTFFAREEPNWLREYDGHSAAPGAKQADGEAAATPRA